MWPLSVSGANSLMQEAVIGYGGEENVSVIIYFFSVMHLCRFLWVGVALGMEDGKQMCLSLSASWCCLTDVGNGVQVLKKLY